MTDSEHADPTSDPIDAAPETANSVQSHRAEARRARVAAAVAQCIETKTYGDTITKAELLTWFAITYPQTGTKREFDRVDMIFMTMKSEFDVSLLTDHKMATESEYGGKWRIVLPSEQAELARRTARNAFTKGIAKAQAITSNVDVAQLNDVERARLDDTSARLAAIRMFASKNIPHKLPNGGGK